MARWGNAVPNRAAQQAGKRKAIIREAAQVFARRGFHGATLDDVADRLGVTKPALYRYVRSKQELLAACHEEAMEIADRALTCGMAQGDTGLAKIRAGLTEYLAEMIGAMGVPVMILEDNLLQGPEAARIHALRDTFEARLRALVEEGMRDGSVVAVDPKLAVFMLLGAVHWVTKWYRPEGAWGAREVSAALVELATRGLAATPSDGLTARLGGGE